MRFILPRVRRGSPAGMGLPAPLRMGLCTNSQGGWRVCKPARGSGVAGGVGMAVGIEEGPVGEHGAGDGQEAVADAAKGAAMAVAASTQGGVAAPADGIMLDRDAGPVVDGVAEAALEGQAPDDEALVAAAAGNGSDAGQGAQGAIVSLFERLVGLGEQRGEDDPSDPGQGAQDRRVTRLVWLPRRGGLVGGGGAQAGEGFAGPRATGG